MSSIALTYSRSDKAIDLSWELQGISATKSIILLTDTQDKASKQIVLDPGTESYTVETDDYFVANPSGTYHFVVMGTAANSATTLVSSNQVSVGLVEIPTPNFDLVPLDKAFRIDFSDNLKNIAGVDSFDAQQAARQNTTWDPEREIIQVVVSVTTTNPLALWQAVYNVADMADNSIIVGKDTDNGGTGLIPAATSNAPVFTDGLVNFQTYEVNVAYVSDETTEGDDNTNTGSLGRGEGTTGSEYVIPSLRFSAPRNVTIVETPEVNNQVDIYWNAPGNDLGKEENNAITTVTKYQVYVTATDPGADAPTFTDDIPADWTLVKDLTLTATDTKYKAYSELAYTQAVSTKRWYVVRAVRILETNPADAELDRDGDADEASYGHFSAPVPFTTFVHTDLEAPTLSTFATAVDVDAVTFNVSSPENATTLELDADGYTAQKLTIGVKARNGDDVQIFDESLTVEQDEQNYTNKAINFTQTDGTPGTTVAFGLSYTFDSAVYTQPGKLIALGNEHNAETPALQSIGTTATEYTSANANGSSQIAGGASVTRTPFQTPAAPASPSSTGLNGNAPLSEADNGKLSFSWTNLASYDSVNGTDSKFFSTIRYRVFGAVTTPTTLSDGNDSYGTNAVENLTGSPVEVAGLTFGESYSLQVQAYFYNNEMGIWVKGAKTTAVSAGNVPFYYPADVTDLAYNSDLDGVEWTTPANSNGVNESNEVAFYFKIETNENDGGYSEPAWQAAANGGAAGASNSYDVTTELGDTYTAKVTSGYALVSVVDVVDTYTFDTNLHVAPGPEMAGEVMGLLLNGSFYGPADNTILTGFTTIEINGAEPATTVEMLNWNDHNSGGTATRVFNVADLAIIYRQPERLYVSYNMDWYVFPRGSTIALNSPNGVTTVYLNEQANGTADIAYLARPLPPTIALTPGDQQIAATFTNDANNDDSMEFVRFEQSIDSTTLADNGTGDDDPASQTYTNLENGVNYTIRAKSFYRYPATSGELFESTVSEAQSSSESNGAAFGKPIIVSASISDAGTAVNIAMKNNGRQLREMLVVGIPADNSIGDQIEVKRFTTTSDPAVQAGSDDNTQRNLNPVTFANPLKEAFVALENEAGTTVTIA